MGAKYSESLREYLVFASFIELNRIAAKVRDGRTCFATQTAAARRS